VPSASQSDRFKAEERPPGTALDVVTKRNVSDFAWNRKSGTQPKAGHYIDRGNPASIGLPPLIRSRPQNISLSQSASAFYWKTDKLLAYGAV
jgi:hypothetical protein